jgi:hypothetical protein
MTLENFNLLKKHGERFTKFEHIRGELYNKNLHNTTYHDNI